jgi:hypothetical protein
MTESQLLPKQFLTMVLLACFLVQAFVHGQAPTDQAVEQAKEVAGLRGLLVRQKLKPPIRSRNTRVKFSPDGKYVLLQSESGSFVFSTNPLKPLVHVETENSYEVRFSRDSQSLIGVSRGLQTARWWLPRGAIQTSGELHIPNGCLTGELSPDGSVFACYRTDLSLYAYDVSSGNKLFGEESHQQFPPMAVVPLSLLTDNIAARPIGIVAVKNFDVYANQGLSLGKIGFSPAGDLLMLIGHGHTSLWNVPSRAKLNSPGALNKHRHDSFCFLDNDRILALSSTEGPEILSVASGKSISKPAFEAAAIRVATNPRYLIISSKETNAHRLFDMESNVELEMPENAGIDVHESTVAVLNPHGKLSFYHLGENIPFASSVVPQDALPWKRFISTSPGLDLVALGDGDQTALFRVATGERIGNLEKTSEQAMPDSSMAFCLKYGKDKEVLGLDSTVGTAMTRWKTTAGISRISPAALFEYEFEGISSRVPEVRLDGKIPYLLSAHELATGRVLWKRHVAHGDGFPFIDPQGHYIVFGWEAQSESAKAAAKRCPEVWPTFKKTKLSGKDTFFEVVNGATGETGGGALVRTGAGPINFDSVLSVGERLIVSSDGGRTTLYSVQDNEAKARLIGGLPAGSSESRLLALADNGTRLNVYDLLSGKKIDQQVFPEPICYLHFSEDGHRLLVLTRQQVVYILDMTGVERARPLVDSMALSNSLSVTRS